MGVVKLPYLTSVVNFKEITATRYLSEVANLTVVRMTTYTGRKRKEVKER